MTDFTKDVIEVIKSIPKGNVMTYGGVAKAAGNPRGARQVSRILHSMSKNHSLPWQRIVNSKGEISLQGEALEHQMEILRDEGIEFSKTGKIDLKKYGYEILICDELDWI